MSRKNKFEDTAREPKDNINSAPTLESIEQFVLGAGSDHVPTFGGSFEGGIQCQQVADEIAPCIYAILSTGKPVKSYLEIGAAAGGTTFLFNYYFRPEDIVLIDDNRHPKAHVRHYILQDIKYTEIIGDSHAPGTVDVLAALGLKFDIVFIDGDHSYPGVKADVKIYREFLKPDGFLIFHDSAVPEFGVKDVVAELKNDAGFKFIGEFKTQTELRPLGVALFRKVEDDAS